MQVSFWSNYHQTGTTCNMVAVSVLAALEYRMRILMTHNHFDRSTLESAFIEKRYIRHELTDLSDTGMDALSRFIKFNKLGKDEITSYTTTILKNRLELLYGTRNTNREIYLSNIKDVIQLILQSATRYYDLIFVDTAPGDENEITLKILEKSDLIIVNLNQNVRVLEDFLSDYHQLKDRILILLGRYNSDSKYNLKAIKKRFGNLEVQTIPYDIGFADACSESRAVDFILKNQTAGKGDIHYPFINGVRETTESIFSLLGLDAMQKKV